MTRNSKIKKMQDFLWDAFCDPDATGVSLDSLLTWPGLHLTSDQVASAEYHWYDPEAWTQEDENIRDVIADATDSVDYDRLFCWLIWTVGDQTAFDLVESWGEE